MTASPDSPTIGAVRRARGMTGWSDTARHMFAVAIVEEARRYVLLERLDGIMHFLAIGGTVDQATERLARLYDELDLRWAAINQEAA